MKITILSLILAMAITSIAFADIQTFESEGNLESNASIEAMELEGIKDEHTPADIFKLVAKNIEKKNYEEAAMAYLVGMAYGIYDTKRVEDRTAHQAIAVLRMNALSGLHKDEQKEFQSALSELIKKDELITKTLEELGKPAYHPRYMIQHGMGAFTGNKTKDGLVSGFDGEKAWKEILKQFTQS
jgi:hypothetical protein